MVKHYSFFPLELDGDEQSVSYNCCLPFSECSWYPLKISGWEGPRAVLDISEKRKMSCPTQELNHDYPLTSSP